MQAFFNVVVGSMRMNLYEAPPSLKLIIEMRASVPVCLALPDF
jgi:hypothetical protein